MLMLTDLMEAGGGSRSRFYGQPVNKSTTGLYLVGKPQNLVVLPSGTIINIALSTSYAARSTDRGKTWSSVPIYAAGNYYSNAAVNGSGTIVSVCNNTNSAMYSTNDGVSWTGVSLTGTYNWYDCCYDAVNGKFIAIGGAPGASCAISATGQSWLAGGAMPSSNYWYNVGCVNGNTVSTVNQTATSTYAYSSNGGVSWVAKTFPVSINSTLIKVINGVMYVLGCNGSVNYCLRSIDGINWTTTILPVAGAPYGMDYGDGMFMFVGNSAGAPIYQTTDFLTWSSVASGMGSDYPMGIVFTAGRWIIGNSSTAANIYSIGN